MDTYVITVWIDTNGKTHTAASTIQAGSISEAKAKFKAKIVSASLLPVYTKNREYDMTRDEFEERRNDFNDRAQERLARQEIENNEYKANLKEGKVSGLGKFIHGVNYILTGLIKNAANTLNNM